MVLVKACFNHGINSNLRKVLHRTFTMPSSLALTNLGALNLAQSRIRGISYLAKASNGYQYVNTQDVYVLLQNNNVYVRLLYDSYQGQQLDLFVQYE